jgi:hypothetical protein
MDAADRDGLYRFAYQRRVFYVQIHPSADLDDDDFAFAPAIRKLLTPPPPDCNCADIRDGRDVIWTRKKLKSVSNCWHPTKIDLRELQPLYYFSTRTCKVLYKSQLAFAKIARFEYEIPWIEKETAVYKAIDKIDIGPRFLAHLTEEGRVMGILLEYISDTQSGSLEDLDICQKVVRRLHKVNVLHNDINMYNFLLRDGRCWMCDFEDCEMNVTDDRLEKEERNLEMTLQDNFRENEDWSGYGLERVARQMPGEYRL